MSTLVNPSGEGESRRRTFCPPSAAVELVVFSFGIFGAAVFAEPAVTEIEEVAGLMHLPACPASGAGDPGT